MTTQKGTLLGATLLVCGTCIGGGMLALPVATGGAGFFPSLFMMVLGWLFMTLTALFLAEVNLWYEPGVHIITMASRLLGRVGKWASALLFLFISYASLVAYTAGGEELFRIALNHLFGISLPFHLSCTLFVLFFTLIIYLGNILVGRINNLLMIGLIGSYFLLLFTGLPFVDCHKLFYHRFHQIYVAAPLLLTIFSFQTIVPSLTIYLKQDGVALRKAIIYGTTLALLVYVVWEYLVLGCVPVAGEHGLLKALEEGKSATQFLGHAVGSPIVGYVADFFALFALITSFLGMGLGLFDFLADGLRFSRSTRNKLLLGLLVALPTLLFALSFKKVFLTALDLTGGIGDALLNGIIPALMLWIGRYAQKKDSSQLYVFGGRKLIIAVILYALFVFTIEILGKVGVISGL